MEARNGDEVNAHASADHDVAPGHNESAAHITINHEDMENINIVDMVAPLAAVPGVLELSEEVSDRIASDNDALTDAFAAQVMEQSVTTDDSISAVNATGKVQLGLLAVGGCVASAALIALLRRIRRGRNKAAEDSSQKISGSGRGSRSVLTPLLVSYPSRCLTFGTLKKCVTQQQIRWVLQEHTKFRDVFQNLAILCNSDASAPERHRVHMCSRNNMCNADRRRSLSR